MVTSPEVGSPIKFPRRAPGECKILIADDEPKVIEVMAYHLERDGYQVISALDGKQALDRLAAESADLVITDVMMPNVDGIELCRRVKENLTTHFIPVIMVTARGSRQTRLEGLGAGADDFIDKPVDALELSTRVRALLYTKQLHDELEANRRDLERRVVARTAELNKAYERLKDLDRLKADFIGNVSHEFRTPLHQARTAIYLLGEKGLAAKERETTLGLAAGALEALSQFVDDILVLGTYGEPRAESTSIAEIIEASIKGLRSLPKRRDAKIEKNIPSDLPLVAVDRRGMTRVLHHLVDNGIKFSDGKPVLITAKAAKDGIRVSVKDEGIGISKEQQRRLSELLYQADTGITRRYGGLGVGLTLSRLVLGAHGAEISIESDMGKGTTISFTLPLAEVEEKSARA